MRHIAFALFWLLFCAPAFAHDRDRGDWWRYGDHDADDRPKVKTAVHYETGPAVPEPSAIALFGVGAAVVAVAVKGARMTEKPKPKPPPGR